MCLMAKQDNDNIVSIENVNIVDVKNMSVSYNRTILIKNELIASIGKASDAKIPDKARRLKANNHYVIPGMWDMHAHITDENYINYYSDILLINGVTGVRNMGSKSSFKTIRRLRDEHFPHGPHRPRIFASGPPLDGLLPDGSQIRGHVVVSNENDASLIVDKMIDDGFDFIKIYSFMDRRSYFAVARRANYRKIPFAGHVPATITAEEASDAGQKCFEHLLGVIESCSHKSRKIKPMLRLVDYAINADEVVNAYDEESARALFARFARNGTWQCPTLIALRPLEEIDDSFFSNDPNSEYLPAPLREAMKPHGKSLKFGFMSERQHNKGVLIFSKFMNMVKTMHESKVKILAGTDTSIYSVPGFNLHDELELLVRAGLPPSAALQAATLNPAEYFGILDKCGTVEPEKWADLVLLSENPLNDIKNTRKIFAVFIRGNLLDQEYIKKAKIKILGGNY